MSLLEALLPIGKHLLLFVRHNFSTDNFNFSDPVCGIPLTVAPTNIFPNFCSINISDGAQKNWIARHPSRLRQPDVVHSSKKRRNHNDCSWTSRWSAFSHWASEYKVLWGKDKGRPGGLKGAGVCLPGLMRNQCTLGHTPRFKQFQYPSDDLMGAVSENDKLPWDSKDHSF